MSTRQGQQDKITCNRARQPQRQAHRYGYWRQRCPTPHLDVYALTTLAWRSATITGERWPPSLSSSTAVSSLLPATCSTAVTKRASTQHGDDSAVRGMATCKSNATKGTADMRPLKSRGSPTGQVPISETQKSGFARPPVLVSEFQPPALNTSADPSAPGCSITQHA